VFPTASSASGDFVDAVEQYDVFFPNTNYRPAFVYHHFWYRNFIFRRILTQWAGSLSTKTSEDAYI